MIQTIVEDTSIPALIEKGKIPKELVWSRALPAKYIVILVRDGKRTIIVCKEKGSNYMAYAILQGDISIRGDDRIFTTTDSFLMSQDYPELGIELERTY